MEIRHAPVGTGAASLVVRSSLSTGMVPAATTTGCPVTSGQGSRPHLLSAQP